MHFMRLNVVLLVLEIKLPMINSQMCTDPLLFGNVIEEGKERLEGTKIITIEEVGLLQCLSICLQYSLCTSINFINSRPICTLLTGNDIKIQSRPDSITTEKKNWRVEMIGGNCNSHNCTNNSKCIETLDGFNCEVIGCVDPPADFRNYEVFGYRIVWPINESVAIPCEDADKCTKLITCRQSGFWLNITYITDTQPPSCLDKNSWTEWFDRDNPGSTGDHENLESISKENPGRVCKYPSALDVRLKDGDSDKLWNDILILSPSLGLRCLNHYQFNGRCDDYKVRFCCET